MTDRRERPILCVIPARGGSKTIPRKVLQPIDGAPLLLRTYETISRSGVADRIVVSTEDAEIASVCRLRGIEVVDRPVELAQDCSTIADVSAHTVQTLGWDGLLLVAQPTCPLLSVDTIVAFVQRFRQCTFDWAIGTTAEPHIFWQDGHPLVHRDNRQQLAADPRCVQRETGALQIMTAEYARTGKGLRTTFPIPADEALDIDTYADLEAARHALGRRTILFHVVASDEKGSGHLRRCLRLSEALGHHNVVWQTYGLEAWALAEAERRGVKFVGDSRVCDLAVIDALDEADRLAPRYAAAGIPTVVLEPDGARRTHRFADVVIDEFADPKWTVLRPEFLNLPARTVAEKGTKVLVTFGGTDPAGLNARVAAMLGYGTDAEVRVIQSPAAAEIQPYPKRTSCGRATVVRDANMAEEMCWADLVVTGQGRTVAEAVACGVPVVSLAQNERESRHAKLPGVLYLGLWAAVSDEALLRTVNRLLDNPILRAEMAGTARASVDGKGVDRICFEVERLLRGL